MRPLGVVIAILTALPSGAAIEARQPATRPLHVDGDGVMRWGDTGEEVALFGVNYYAPHVIDYQKLTALGLSIEPVIDQDLDHFVRMGLDALRIHVFDREISDPEGNLVANDHLQLLDYLIAGAKERGMYTVLTPIAWWGTPNPGDGFSNRFTMPEMTTNPIAWDAQKRYLAQFVDHLNPYTGLRYKEDPCIPAFELINEPLYPQGITASEISAYVRALAEAVRSTGCTKPIFYNTWQGHPDVVAAAGIEGSTFGWYPSGLVAGRSLTANFLPVVDGYPAMRAPKLAGKAKIVYEFDAADLPGSYLYAAMARAFRSGGAQIATQFQYDPLPLAPFNATWQTHYLNLVYAPRRALGFMVAAEVFRRTPRLADFGRYPGNTRFGPFRVSYENDLAEMAAEDAFLYSNDTDTAPPDPGALRQVAGCGSSPAVEYAGAGAYFLDKAGVGVWRLEVYPDAVWVADPFGANPSLEREVSRVIWRAWPMAVHLPDLGDGFTVTPLNDGNARPVQTAAAGAFTVQPGVYMLSVPGAAPVLAPTAFHAPPSSDAPPAVWHAERTVWVESAPLLVRATVAAAEPPVSVTLHILDGERMPMQPAGPYEYAAEITPGGPGLLEYAIEVELDDAVYTFPGGRMRSPSDGPGVMPPAHVLYQPRSGQDAPPIAYSGPEAQSAVSSVETHEDGGPVLRLSASGFGEGASCASVRVPAAALGAVPSAWPGDWRLVVSARSLEPETRAIEVGLIEANGKAFGFNAAVSPDWRDIAIPLSELRPLWGTPPGMASVPQIQAISLIFGTWLFPDAREKAHALEVRQIRVEPYLPAWTVPIVAQDAPVTLFDAGVHEVTLLGSVPHTTAILAGPAEGTTAFRVGVAAFEAPPSCLTFRNEIDQDLVPRRGYLGQCGALVLVARAGEPATTGVEVVVRERDGAAWGLNAPLTGEWQTLRIPISELRFYKHWAGVPEERGGEGDRFHPEDTASISFCFGAWLYGDRFSEPHAIEIARVTLER